MELNENYLSIMNKEVPGDFMVSTLDKIVINPQVFNSDLSANSFSLSLISSYGQSRNIKYGNAIEKVFSKILQENGWTIKNTNYKLEDYSLTGIDVGNPTKKAVSVDHVISYEDKVILIEQKIRDNHDTSKWEGQLENYKVKYTALEKIFSKDEKTVYGIMWMVDPTYHRNKDAYQSKLASLGNFPIDKNFVLIGHDIDEKLNELMDGDSKEYFEKLRSFLEGYHKQTAGVPDCNLESEKVEYCFKKLKNTTEEICRLTEYFIKSSNRRKEKLFRCFSDPNFPLEEIMPTGVAFIEYKDYMSKLSNSKRTKFEKEQFDADGQWKDDCLLAQVLSRYE